jgi:DNA-binding CsgD family transcriptional regulator
MLSALIGRAAAVAALEEDLDAVTHGDGRCLVVEGPVGIGKSLLLKEASVLAVGRGLVVAEGTATPFDRAVPLRALLNPLRSTIDGDIRAELDIDGRDELSNHRLWFIETLGEHIERFARTGALVVAIDDAHWADELTALALRVLVPALAGVPVLWLLARRPVLGGNAAHAVIDWLIGEGSRRLRLGPLGHDASTRLCTSVLGAKPDPTILALAARCEGHPFLLRELLGALRDSGQLLTAGAVASAQAASLPRSFMRTVAGRMDDLSDSTRRLIMVGAAFGRPFTPQEIGPMVGLSSAELLQAIEEAIRVDLLAAIGPSLGFRNDLVREAIHGNMLEPMRSALGEVAAVPASDRPPSGTPGQAAGGGQAIRQPVIRPHSGKTARGTSPGEAAADEDFTARIVEELGERCRDEPDPVAQAVGVLASAGRASEAKRLARALRPGDEDIPIYPSLVDASDARLWLWLARGLIAADRFAEADLVLSIAKREVSQLGDERSQLLCIRHRAELRMKSGLLDDAQAEAEEALWAAERVSLSQLCVAPLALLARVGICRDEMGVADDYLHRAAQLAVEGAQSGLHDLTWALTLFHDAAGRPIAAIDALTDICNHPSSRLLLFAETPTAPAELIRLARQTGEASAVEMAVAAARQLAQRNPDVTSLSAGAIHAEGMLRSERQALCDAAEKYRSAGRPLAQAVALEDAAWVERKAGNEDRAAALLRLAFDACRRSGARRDAARIQGRLRCLAGPRSSCDRSASAWNSLTEAEMRVVQIIAEGLTNREAASRLFLSPHTVDSHLRHVFTKLSINSRVELTREVLMHSATSITGSRDDPLASDLDRTWATPRSARGP